MQIDVSPRQWELTESNAGRVWGEIMQSIVDRADYIAGAQPLDSTMSWSHSMIRDNSSRRIRREEYMHAHAQWVKAQQYTRIVIDPRGLFTWYKGVPSGELFQGEPWDTIPFIPLGRVVQICGVPIATFVTRTEPTWENRVTLL